MEMLTPSSPRPPPSSSAPAPAAASMGSPTFSPVQVPVAAPFAPAEVSIAPLPPAAVTTNKGAITSLPPMQKRSKSRRSKAEEPMVTSSLLFSAFCRRDQIEAVLERLANSALANGLEWKPRKSIGKSRRRSSLAAPPDSKLQVKKHIVAKDKGKDRRGSSAIVSKKPKPLDKDVALREMLLSQKSERGARSDTRKTHLLELLDKLKKRDKYRFFHVPVDTAVVSDYLDVIKKPMDFGTIKRKIERGKYDDIEQFRLDVMLVFENCMLYNRSDTVYYQHAESIAAYAERLINETKRVVEPEETPPLISPYTVISNYELPVDAENLQWKLLSSKVGNCDGDCCYTLQDLGAYNVNNGQFHSRCCDRERLTECGDACKCDPDRCLNRAVTLKRGKRLGVDLEKKEVFGIDSYTHRLIAKMLSKDMTKPQAHAHFIESKILPAINKHVPHDASFRRRLHMPQALTALMKEAQRRSDSETVKWARLLLHNVKAGVSLPVYSKGHGIVCINAGGFKKNEFIAEYMGEVYAPWRWFEKQSVHRAVQKSYSMPFSFGFYNIMLERHKDDEEGYDVLFVDACRKGNFSSRLSHSCSPNCTSVVMAANGRFSIVVLALRDIAPSEELTFDYHSVTESAEEQKNAVCFCGWSSCRGRYVNYAGPDTFQQVISAHHDVCQRTSLLIKACSIALNEADRERLRKYRLLGSVTKGAPDWLLKFASLVLEFVEFEKETLPRDLLKLRRYGYTKETAEFDTIGVTEGRIQSLAIAMDKVKYVLRQAGQVQEPPIVVLNDEQVFERIWNADDSVIASACKRIAPLLDEIDLVRLVECTSVKVTSRRELQTQLLELRDLLRSMPPSTSSFHHVAADIVHLYAHTDTFFSLTSYNLVRSPPVDVTELGLNISDPNDEALLTPKPYTQYFIWGCLMYWFKQSLEKPDATAHNSKRGLVVLPSIEACYSSSNRHELGDGYSVAQRKALITRLKSAPAPGPWPRDRIWDFRMTNDRVYGTPLLDAVHTNKDLRHVVKSLQAWTPNIVDREKGLYEVMQSPKRRRRRVSRFDDVSADGA